MHYLVSDNTFGLVHCLLNRSKGIKLNTK